MEFVVVTVQVPQERLGDFHQMYGNWLQAGQPGEGRAPTAIEWTGRDNGLSAAMRSRLPKNAWTLLRLLSTEGETEAASILQRLGLKDTSQLNGVNGWVGRVSHEFGRKTPIKSKLVAGKPVWWVEPEVAELFKRLKA